MTALIFDLILFNFAVLAVPEVPVIRIIPTYSQQEKILLSLSIAIMELVRYKSKI